jgi:hypothetical protein
MALSSVNISDFKGLYNQPNSFSLVPPGALEVASNVVFTQDGVIKKCRGFAELTLTVSHLVVNGRGLFSYGSTYLYAMCLAKLIRIDPNAGDSTTIAGSYTASSSYTPHAAQASKNAYLTGSTKIWKLEEESATLIAAGIPPGLDLAVTLSTNTGILNSDKIVGYRVLFGRKDYNSNKVVGAPSQLTTVTNPKVSATWSQALLVVTITSVAHGLSTNDLVTITGAATLYVNVTDQAVTVTGADTFTYTVATSASTSGSLYWGVYKKPTLSITVPASLASSTSHFYQIYRTSQVAVSVRSEEHTSELQSRV